MSNHQNIIKSNIEGAKISKQYDYIKINYTFTDVDI